MSVRSFHAKPLEYRVVYTSLKPGSRPVYNEVSLSAETLTAAMTVVLEKYANAVLNGSEIAIRLETPAGGVFVDAAWWPGK